MSYRSKRTMACKNEDETKKQVKVTVQQSSTIQSSNSTDGRWGPFIPPTSQPSSKIIKSETPAQSSKSRTCVAPPAKFAEINKSEAVKKPPFGPSSNIVNPTSQSISKVIQPEAMWKQYPFGSTHAPVQRASTASPSSQPSQVNKPEIIWKRTPTETSQAAIHSNSEQASRKRGVSDEVGYKGPLNGKKTPRFCSDPHDRVPLNQSNMQPKTSELRQFYPSNVVPNAAAPTAPPKTAPRTAAPPNAAPSTAAPADATAIDAAVGAKKDSNAKKTTEAPKFQRKVTIPDWNVTVEYDYKEEVLSIDPNGNHQLISGQVQLMDIWNNNGVKYFVHFNDLYQPIRKGGHLLIKFLSSIAKQERFCPVGELNWHKIDRSYKTDIIKQMRARFVIPDGEIYDDKALQRVDKSWRQYRYVLRSTYYRPKEKSLEEHYSHVPSGIGLGNWKNLVKYWASDDFRKLSQLGQDARATQVHFHTTGGTSYANKRADYFDEHGEDITLWQLFEESHKRKDGSFIEGSVTQDFLEDVRAKADTLKQMDPSGDKSHQDIENEAFEKVMYGDEIPDRPQGFGFGVRKSSIYGVQGMLRKEGYGKVHKRPVQVNTDFKDEISALNKRNEVLEKQNQDLQIKVEENSSLLKAILDIVRSGKTSTQLLNATELALRTTNRKVSDRDGTSG